MHILKIDLGQSIMTSAFYIHQKQNIDLIIGNDIVTQLLPLTINRDQSITFTYANLRYHISTKIKATSYIGNIMPALPQQNQNRFLDWFN